jgi:hypothetical protein
LLKTPLEGGHFDISTAGPKKRWHPLALMSGRLCIVVTEASYPRVNTRKVAELRLALRSERDITNSSTRRIWSHLDTQM